MYGSILALAILALAPVPQSRGEATTKMNEGVDLAAKRDFAGAEKALTEASHIDPTYDYVWLNLGVVYQRQGKLVDAEKAFETGMASSAGDILVELRYRLGVVTEAQARAEGVSRTEKKAKLAQAVAHYEAVAKADPKRAQPSLRAGRCHVDLDDPTKADLAFREAIRRNPRLTAAYVELGRMYVDYGHENVGMAILETGAKVNDTDAAIWLGLGGAYLDLDKPNDAVEAFEKAKRIDPDLPQALFGLGMSHAAANHRKESIENLEAFLSKAGGDVPEHLKHAANNTIARMQDVL